MILVQNWTAFSACVARELFNRKYINMRRLRVAVSNRMQHRPENTSSAIAARKDGR